MANLNGEKYLGRTPLRNGMKTEYLPLERGGV
jgi:hypothetical protein